MSGPYFSDTDWDTGEPIEVRNNIYIRTPYVIRQGDDSPSDYAYNILRADGQFNWFSDGTEEYVNRIESGTIQFGSLTDTPVDIIQDGVPAIEIDISGNVNIPGTLTVGGVSISINFGSVQGPVSSGIDISAPNQESEGSQGTGIGTPSAVTIKVPVLGVTGSTPQVMTEGFRVQEVANATSREIVIKSPVIHGGLAVGNAVWNENGDTGRFMTRIQGVRFGNSFGVNIGRANGTESIPTPLLASETPGAINVKGYDSANAWVTVAQLRTELRENLTGIARGSQWIFAVYPTGSTTLVNIARFRAGSATISEWDAGGGAATVLRIITPSSLFAVRESSNTSDSFSINPAGTTILAPLVTSFVLGTDPGGSELLRIGGSLRVQNIVLSGGDTISRVVNTGVTVIYGGISAGGNVRVFGSTHASQANDVEFRVGGNVVGAWDDSVTSWLHPTTTSFVIGSDPGGSDLLRVGGNARIANIRLSSTDASIFNNAATGTSRFSGGSSGDNGGNIKGYGESHASQANDIELRRGSTIVAMWDDSVTSWLHPTTTSFVIGTDPGGSEMVRVTGSIRASVNYISNAGGYLGTGTNASSVFSGSNSISVGANMRVFGSTHATQAYDVEFRRDTTVVATWDDSVTSWLFPTTTSFVIGTDPTGTGVLRVGGVIRAGDYINTNNALTRSSSTGYHVFTGGTTESLGGSVKAYAQTHASQANDIEFRTATTVKGFWDDSDTKWIFSDNFLSIVASGADPSANFTTENQAVIAHGSSHNSLGLYRGSADTGGAALVLYKSRSATLSTRSAVLSGDIIGTVTGQGASTASQSLNGGQIRFEATALWANNSATAKIVFGVANGAATMTDRWEIIAPGTLQPVTDGGVSLGAAAQQVLNGFFSGTVRAEQINLLASNPYIKQDTGTNANFAQMFGGAINNGGSVKVYGGSHGTKANDIEFITGSTIQGFFDFSSALWQIEDPLNINDSLGLRVQGTKVVGAQGALIADASGGAVIDSEARTAINALLARLRTHGLIAT